MLVHSTRQRHGCGARQHATALHTYVDLDDHRNPYTFTAPGRIELGHVIQAVYRDNDLCLPAEVGQSSDLRRADHLIGNENTLDAGGHHHFSLAELGTGDANGAGRYLAMSNRRCLVPLAVRTPRHAGLAQDGDSLGDIPIHCRDVDQKSGCVDILNRPSNNV